MLDENIDTISVLHQPFILVSDTCCRCFLSSAFRGATRGILLFLDRARLPVILALKSLCKDMRYLLIWNLCVLAMSYYCWVCAVFIFETTLDNEGEKKGGLAPPLKGCQVIFNLSTCISNQQQFKQDRTFLLLLLWCHSVSCSSWGVENAVMHDSIILLHIVILPYRTVNPTHESSVIYIYSRSASLAALSHAFLAIFKALHLFVDMSICPTHPWASPPCQWLCYCCRAPAPAGLAGQLPAGRGRHRAGPGAAEPAAEGGPSQMSL